MRDCTEQPNPKRENGDSGNEIDVVGLLPELKVFIRSLRGAIICAPVLLPLYVIPYNIVPDALIGDSLGRVKLWSLLGLLAAPVIFCYIKIVEPRIIGVQRFKILFNLGLVFIFILEIAVSLFVFFGHPNLIIGRMLAPSDCPENRFFETVERCNGRDQTVWLLNIGRAKKFSITSAPNGPAVIRDFYRAPLRNLCP